MAKVPIFHHANFPVSFPGSAYPDQTVRQSCECAARRVKGWESKEKEDVMSREYPDRPFVGVGVVIWRGDELLLIQRGKEPRRGQWSIPGGMQELGETTREAALREVREETNLDIEVTHMLDVIDTISRDEDDRVRMQYVLIDFAAEWLGREAIAGSDAMGVRWVRREDLPEYKLWSETLRIIDKSAELR